MIPPEESVELETLARLHLWLPVFTHPVTTSEIKTNKQDIQVHSIFSICNICSRVEFPSKLQVQRLQSFSISYETPMDAVLYPRPRPLGHSTLVLLISIVVNDRPQQVKQFQTKKMALKRSLGMLISVFFLFIIKVIINDTFYL